MPKQPEDHKPAKGGEFRFTDSKGKTHTLPPVTVGASKLTGRDLRDAAVGGEVGQLGYLFKTLEAANPPQATLDALYEMPQAEMVAVLNEWGEFGDGDGASLGE